MRRRPIAADARVRAAGRAGGRRGVGAVRVRLVLCADAPIRVARVRRRRCRAARPALDAAAGSVPGAAPGVDPYATADSSVTSSPPRTAAAQLPQRLLGTGAHHPAAGRAAGDHAAGAPGRAVAVPRRGRKPGGHRTRARCRWRRRVARRVFRRAAGRDLHGRVQPCRRICSSASSRSIREQTYRNWRCVISDDCSRARGPRRSWRAVGDDPRFIVSRSPRRLGFYRNFERALTLAPAEARVRRARRSGRPLASGQAGDARRRARRRAAGLLGRPRRLPRRGA